MKLFKQIALSVALTMGAFSLVTYTACNKDECKDVECLNGGVCESGNCNCLSGWEGTRCETNAATKLSGQWTVSNNSCSNVGSTWVVTITPTATAGQFIIANYSHVTCTAPISVTGSITGSTVNISSQKLCSPTSEVTATGQLSADGTTLTMSYQFNEPTLSPNSTGTCTETYTKI